MDFSIIKNDDTASKDGILQFGKIELDEKYKKKWNVHQNDFIGIVKNGHLLRPTLYRIGGINNPKLGTDKYFMLLKYSEAVYSKEFIDKIKSRSSQSNKHLESYWVILNHFGEELIEFKKNLDYPCIIKDSCIYEINSKYYNIETGYFYGYSSKTMKSKDFLFLENHYDNDESKKGIMKIDLKTGDWEVFK